MCDELNELSDELHDNQSNLIAYYQKEIVAQLERIDAILESNWPEYKERRIFRFIRAQGKGAIR